MYETIQQHKLKRDRREKESQKLLSHWKWNQLILYTVSDIVISDWYVQTSNQYWSMGSEFLITLNEFNYNSNHL